MLTYDPVQALARFDFEILMHALKQGCPRSAQLAFFGNNISLPQCIHDTELTAV